MKLTEGAQQGRSEHKVSWQRSILDKFVFLKHAFKIAAFSFPGIAAKQISDAPNVLKTGFVGRGSIF